MTREERENALHCLKVMIDEEDKEELIRTLQYDRNQYSKGYEDGKNDVIEKLKADIQRLRNCTCSCSDGIIDEVEDIIDGCR